MVTVTSVQEELSQMWRWYVEVIVSTTSKSSKMQLMYLEIQKEYNAENYEFIDFMLKGTCRHSK